MPRRGRLANREQALQWLDRHTSAGAPPVFLPDEVPHDVLRILRRLDLVIRVPGGVLVVRSPGDEPTRVLQALVWPIIQALTRIYDPAVVERDSAVRLYLGRTDPGPEIRIRQTGRTRWREEIAPGIVVRVERGDVKGARAVSVGEARIPVARDWADPESDIPGYHPLRSGETPQPGATIQPPTASAPRWRCIGDRCSRPTATTRDAW